MTVVVPSSVNSQGVLPSRSQRDKQFGRVNDTSIFLYLLHVLGRVTSSVSEMRSTKEREKEDATTKGGIYVQC